MKEITEDYVTGYIHALQCVLAELREEGNTIEDVIRWCEDQAETMSKAQRLLRRRNYD